MYAVGWGVFPESFKIRRALAPSAFSRGFGAFPGRSPMIIVYFQALIYLMGDEWRAQRMTMTKAFHVVDLKNMTRDFVAVGTKLCAYLEGVAASGKVIDIVPALKAATLDVMGIIAFGYDFGGVAGLPSGFVPPVVEAFQFMVTEHTRRLFSVSPFALDYALPSAANRKHASCRKMIRDTLDDILTKRRAAIREHGAEALHDDLLKHMLVATETDTTGVFTNDAFIDNMITLVFAGYDTTSTGLGFALWQLAENTDARCKLQRELDAGMPAAWSQITAETMSQLRFARACFEEGMRLFPPVPGVLRTTTSPVTLSTGVELPSGTMVFAPTTVLHRDPHNWPDEPGAPLSPSCA